MATLREIQARLSEGEFDLSRHAFNRAVERNISDSEIMEAGSHAKIIEDYPEDKYTPSCLIFGFTDEGRPLHIQVSRADTEFVKIITLYEPDDKEWESHVKRK